MSVKIPSTSATEAVPIRKISPNGTTYSKTDRSDATLLARYGQVFQPPSSQLADESLHQLRQQHKHLNDLRISQ